MKIRVERSSQWVAAQQVETGRNVNQYVEVEVDPAQLSVESRAAIITCWGEYPPAMSYLKFNNHYDLSRHYNFGFIEAKVDADAPTVGEIDASIRSGVAELEEKRAAWAAEKAAREAEETARSAARELLKDEFAKVRAEVDGWRKSYDECHADRRVLAEFLSAVPDDALRGTLKTVCASEEAIAEKRKAVEDASPVVIFADEEDDE